MATCQRNISQHCWAQHVACVWPPCCDVLWYVGCCWLKFENGQIWANNIQHLATCHNTVAKRTQHVAPNNVAICCVGMLRSSSRGLKQSEFRLPGLERHTEKLFPFYLDYDTPCGELALGENCIKIISQDKSNFSRCVSGNTEIY